MIDKGLGCFRISHFFQITLEWLLSKANKMKEHKTIYGSTTSVGPANQMSMGKMLDRSGTDFVKRATPLCDRFVESHSCQVDYILLSLTTVSFVHTPIYFFKRLSIKLPMENVKLTPQNFFWEHFTKT